MDDEIVDSGIIGYTIYDELEEIRKESEEKDDTIENLNEEIDGLESDLSFIESDRDMYEEKLNYYMDNLAPDCVKSEFLYNLKLKLSNDNMLTKELEEWLDNIERFYIGDM